VLLLVAAARPGSGVAAEPDSVADRIALYLAESNKPGGESRSNSALLKSDTLLYKARYGEKTQKPMTANPNTRCTTSTGSSNQ
jgi:hypothetical protein